MSLCARANHHLSSDEFYLALMCVDSIEREFLSKEDGTPSSTIRNMLEDRIPAIRSDIQRRVGIQFGDWLVEIRSVSMNLGQLAIGQASAARQREEELSNDCGTYVCYAMEQLAKREPIPQKIKVDEMLQFKASMVQTFVDRFDMMRLDKTVKLPRIRINS